MFCVQIFWSDAYDCDLFSTSSHDLHFEVAFTAAISKWGWMSVFMHNLDRRTSTKLLEAFARTMNFGLAF